MAGIRAPFLPLGFLSLNFEFQRSPIPSLLLGLPLISHEISALPESRRRHLRLKLQRFLPASPSSPARNSRRRRLLPSHIFTRIVCPLSLLPPSNSLSQILFSKQPGSNSNSPSFISITFYLSLKFASPKIREDADFSSGSLSLSQSLASLRRLPSSPVLPDSRRVEFAVAWSLNTARYRCWSPCVVKNLPFSVLPERF